MRRCAAHGWVLLSLLCGCTGKQEGTTICFAFQDLETEFWVAAYKAITTTLREKGIKVVEYNAHEDPNRQLEQIRDAIVQGVDGMIVIPQDGDSALKIIDEANRAGVPIGIFNRPPANDSNAALVIVADNAAIAEKTVDYMVAEAGKLGRKATPLILVGDLGDPNAVERRDGFYRAIRKHPERFNRVVEVDTRWDPNTTLRNLKAALQENPQVDLIFTSSDFLYPQVRAVLEPMGKWKKRGEEGHVILGGLDGDQGACRLMKEGYVDATGVQDLFYEANAIMEAVLGAIEAGERAPKRWMDDPGFALTQENLAEREMAMWGCKLLAGKEAAEGR